MHTEKIINTWGSEDQDFETVMLVIDLFVELVKIKQYA